MLQRWVTPSVSVSVCVPLCTCGCVCVCACLCIAQLRASKAHVVVESFINHTLKSIRKHKCEKSYGYGLVLAWLQTLHTHTTRTHPDEQPDTNTYTHSEGVGNLITHESNPKIKLNSNVVFYWILSSLYVHLSLFIFLLPCYVKHTHTDKTYSYTVPVWQIV